MRYVFLILVMMLGTQVSQGQFLKKLEDKAVKSAERTVERRVEKESSKKTDKALDEVFEGDNKKSKKEKKNDKKNKGKNAGDSSDSGSGGVNTAKDFARGNKVIFHEQFSKDVIGDFPGTWNTNSSGEVVTFGKDNTRWLKLSKGTFMPEGITSIPNNSTLEMDIRADNVYNASSLLVQLISSDDKTKLNNYYNSKNAVHILLAASYKTSGGVKVNTKVDGTETIKGNGKSTKQFSGDNNIVHLSIWRQDGRIRVYLNDEKVYDLPRAFANKNYNTLVFQQDYGGNTFYVSNIILATDAGADTRHKLLETGSFTSNEILFDSGKSTLQSLSFPILNEIGEIMKSNPSKHLTIIGHTDSDGLETANQTLSEQRAESVKKYLTSKFGISGSKITTAGKGESQPVEGGNSAQAKAKNRRVEFTLK